MDTRTIAGAATSSPIRPYGEWTAPVPTPTAASDDSAGTAADARPGPDDYDEAFLDNV